jgi:hypothetical protein
MCDRMPGRMHLNAFICLRRPCMPSLDDFRASPHSPVVVTPDASVAAPVPLYDGSAEPSQQIPINGPSFEVDSSMFKVRGCAEVAAEAILQAGQTADKHGPGSEWERVGVQQKQCAALRASPRRADFVLRCKHSSAGTDRSSAACYLLIGSCGERCALVSAPATAEAAVLVECASHLQTSTS